MTYTIVFPEVMIDESCSGCDEKPVKTFACINTSCKDYLTNRNFVWINMYSRCKEHAERDILQFEDVIQIRLFIKLFKKYMSSDNRKIGNPKLTLELLNNLLIT